MILTLSAIFASCDAYAQVNDHQYIKKKITAKGNCKNLAMTCEGGELAIFGSNGWSTYGCPDKLVDALEELNGESLEIIDVVLTEKGEWLILCEQNIIRYSSIPNRLRSEIDQFISHGETLTSVSFDDNGQWAVTSPNYFGASSDAILDWIDSGCGTYGTLYSISITNDAMVAVYENGILTKGKIPVDLHSAYDRCNFSVRWAKIAGSHWFFSDGKGRYLHSF